MHPVSLSSSFNKFVTAIVILALLLVARPISSAFAASITVDILTDENANNATCSLREAIIAANLNAAYFGCEYTGTGPDDVITLTSGSTYTLSIVGSNEVQGDLDIGGVTSGNLTIQASGSTNATIDANDINRVMEVDALGNTSLTLINITVTDGNAPDGAGISFAGTGTLTLNNSEVSDNTATGGANCGAGIYNDSLAMVNIVNSTIKGNSCVSAGADGGGLFKGSGGTLTITNSIFYSNNTMDNGGGARIDMASGTATITNSTFANNIAGSKGGGLQVKSGTVTVSFSTFSGNAANSVDPSTGGAVQADGGTIAVNQSILANSLTNSNPGMDCDQLSPGTVTVTNTLIEMNSDCNGTIAFSLDPALGTLADNGGTTLTLALLPTSPAINVADDANCPSTDQRGVARPQGPHCDLGAFEIQATFTDVPTDYWSWSFIEQLVAAGVTSGCNTTPLMYCPTTVVTRDQMAVFLLRGIHGSSYVPPEGTGMFGDVPDGYWAEDWIEQLADEGITAGCGGGNFCPTTPVTRDQMAVFLLKAKHGSGYNPPEGTGVFDDVPDGYWAEDWIEQLADEGITAGCGGGNFCPSLPVTRDQMAVFLVRTFNLP